PSERWSLDLQLLHPWLRTRHSRNDRRTNSAAKASGRTCVTHRYLEKFKTAKRGEDGTRARLTIGVKNLHRRATPDPNRNLFPGKGRAQSRDIFAADVGYQIAECVDIKHFSANCSGGSHRLWKMQRFDAGKRRTERAEWGSARQECGRGGEDIPSVEGGTESCEPMAGRIDPDGAAYSCVARRQRKHPVVRPDETGA